MAEGPQAPYTDRDRRRALFLAALLGWAGVTGLEFVGTDWNLFIGLLPFAAIFGLPVAFLATWLVGSPILRRAMRYQIGWRKAAKIGAFIAAIIVAISIIIGRLNGLRISYDPTFDFQLGGGDYVREVDGILTLYGWLIVAKNSAMFIALGAAIGLVVRATLGPGNRLPKA
jgi:hypothetical protein